MTIMIVRPMAPLTSRSGLVSVQYPINIGYLVAFLRSSGIECIVRDFEVEPFDKDRFLRQIGQLEPAIVGFSCMTPHITDGAKLARLVKENFPEALTVMGGVHGTAIPEQTLEEFPQFDVIAIGEGEETLLELCQKSADRQAFSDILGIAYRQNGRIFVNERRPPIKDLDSLPFPERDLIGEERYRTSHVSRGFSRAVLKISEITTSRGCPYDCIFCASKVAHLRRVRFRSPENIIAEMQELIDAGTRHFSFLDDTMTLRKDVLFPVCDFMKSAGVTFDCFTRVTDIDREKLKRMLAGGCKKISFGIESGSPRIQKLLKKGITIAEAEKAVRLCRELGLEMIETTFMIGTHPEETLEDIDMTERLMHKLRPDILGLAITIPYPGTEINKILKERGLLVKENWEEFTLFFGDPSWEVSDVPMAELKLRLKKMAKNYYLSPRYIATHLKRLGSWNEMKYWLGVGLSFVKATTGRLQKKKAPQ